MDAISPRARRSFATIAAPAMLVAEVLAFIEESLETRKALPVYLVLWPCRRDLERASAL